MINVGNDGKIADVCAAHEDGLSLSFEHLCGLEMGIEEVTRFPVEYPCRY